MIISTDWKANNIEEMFQYVDPNAIPAPVANQRSGKPSFEICGLLSRQKEEEELGEPSERARCFGCQNAAQDAIGAVSSEEFCEIADILRKGIGNTDPTNLAMDVAERYEDLRQKANKHNTEEKRKWLPWPAADILNHIRNHNTEPMIQTWLTQTEYQEIKQIALKASIKRNKETGEISVDEKQFRIYNECVKSCDLIAKSDPTKKLFYGGDKHIDTRVFKEGVVSHSGKNLYSYFNKRHKKN